jgi:hypothetical protein
LTSSTPSVGTMLWKKARSELSILHKENDMDLKTLEHNLVAHANMGMDAIYAENAEALKFHKNAIDEIHRLIEKLKGESK